MCERISPASAFSVTQTAERPGSRDLCERISPASAFSVTQTARWWGDRSGELAGAGDFVGREGGGGGNVQRADAAEHRDRDDRVAPLADKPGQPGPSAPSTRQIGSVASDPSSNNPRSAASSRPTIQMPRSVSLLQRRRQARHERDRHVFDRPGRRLGHGRRHVHGAVSGQQHPVTPAPSQLRMIAPRLPGSVTPSTATRNGAVPRRRATARRDRPRGAAANAITPCGASLRASRSSLERRRSSPAPVGRGDLDDVVDARRRPRARARSRSRAPCGARHQQLAHRLATLDLPAAEPLPAVDDRVGAAAADPPPRLDRRAAGHRPTAVPPDRWPPPERGGLPTDRTLRRPVHRRSSGNRLISAVASTRAPRPGRARRAVRRGCP